MIRIHATGAKMISVHDGCAVRDMGVVVVNDPPVIPPIKVPVVPSPTETAEQPHTEPEPKPDTRTIKEKAGIWIPAGKRGQWSPVHQPGIILRHVHDIRLSRLDHDRLAFSVYGLLWRAVLVASLLLSFAHRLNRLGDI